MAKIKYEKHPVSPERKKELREQGYKIIDARFDPHRSKKGEAKKADEPKAVDKPAG